jgi:hypothetical protein
MVDRVVIHTIHDPVYGISGEMYVNNVLLFTIRHCEIDYHVNINTVTFEEDTIRKMDTLIKDWIRDNLKK